VVDVVETYEIEDSVQASAVDARELIPQRYNIDVIVVNILDVETKAQRRAEKLLEHTSKHWQVSMKAISQNVTMSRLLPLYQ
jgi:hypothetical protein